MDTEEIAQITVSGKSEGMDKVKSDLDGVTKAQDNLAQSSAAVATVTETTAKKQLDAGAAFDQLKQKLEGTYGAAQALARGQATVNAALDQGKASQSDAALVMDLLTQRYQKAGEAHSAFSQTLDRGRDTLIGYAVEGGVVGGILGSFGPWGIAAAAGLRLVTDAFEYLNEGAKKFGESSVGIRNFADAAGLSTTEVRGLSEAAAQAGLAGDQVTTSFERFTANLETARTGTGALFDSVAKINPALAVELAITRSGGIGAYSSELQKATGVTDQWCR
jgi:hypothetical protein